MKIVVDDGTLTVQLRVGEAKALVEAARLCGLIAEWLGDDDAREANTRLLLIAERHVAKEGVAADAD